MLQDELYHHGIKGMRWGIRRFQNEDGTLTKAGKDRYSTSTPSNTVLLKDYSGPCMFVSSNKNMTELIPRVPKNYFTEHGYEDSTTSRVSFAPSIDKCLAGLSQNLDGKTFTVYEPDDVSKYKVFKPNNKAVPDSSITDEMWICEPVKLKAVGTITITGNKGDDGKVFTYGDHQAELYDDWTYDFLEKDSLSHHGIKGMHWGIRRFQNEDGSRTSLGLKHLAATRPSRAGESFSESSKKSSKQSTSEKTKTTKIQTVKPDTKEDLFSPEEKELLKETAKTVAKVGAGLTLAYGGAKLGSVASSAVTAHGKDIAIFALKQVPNMPMATIQGYKDTINLGMAVTKGGTTAGKALMKTGGSLVKVSGKIASAALR